MLKMTVPTPCPFKPSLRRAVDATSALSLRISHSCLSTSLWERGFHSKHSDVNWWLDTELVRGVSDFVDYEGNPLRPEAPDRGGGASDFGE